MANISVSLPATGDPASASADPSDTITFTNNTGKDITGFATWTDNNPGNNKIFSPMPALQSIPNGSSWKTPTINGSAQGNYTYHWDEASPQTTPRSGTIGVS